MAEQIFTGRSLTDGKIINTDIAEKSAHHIRDHNIVRVTPVILPTNVNVKQEPVDEDIHIFENDSTSDANIPENDGNLTLIASIKTKNIFDELDDESVSNDPNGIETRNENDLVQPQVNNGTFVSVLEKQEPLDEPVVFEDAESIVSNDCATPKLSETIDVGLQSHVTNYILEKVAPAQVTVSFNCMYCNASYTRERDLKRHQNYHSKVRLPSVQGLGHKDLPQDEENQQEVKRHRSDQKLHSCDMCHARFSRKSALYMHKHVHTVVKPFICEYCDARFSHKGNLIRHIRTHTGDKPYSCVHCEVRFAEKGNLASHIRTHTGDKPYQCVICDAAFSQMGLLTLHKKKHTEEKPCVCTECDARFFRNSDLARHRRIHTGERPYGCRFCEAMFLRPSDLMRHETIHSGRKPFKCVYCDVSFARKAVLTIHERIHTGEKPYTCGECGKKFARKHEVGRHRRVHIVEQRYS